MSNSYFKYLTRQYKPLDPDMPRHAATMSQSDEDTARLKGIERMMVAISTHFNVPVYRLKGEPGKDTEND